MDFRDQGTLRRRWEGSYNQELYSQLSDSLRFGHIHIRRRPKCPAAETVQHYLLDCAAPLERLLWRYRHR